ncbi:hypothetical protein ACRAWF_01890 [Streptomyces sp. L7]
MLAGDALIVLAFKALARSRCSPLRLTQLIATIGDAVGVPHGISAGQAWECEPRDRSVALSPLQDRRAVRGGHRVRVPLRQGMRIRKRGARSARPSARPIGSPTTFAVPPAMKRRAKPVGQDAALGRPNAVLIYGLTGAVSYLHDLVADGIRTMPPCAHAHELRMLMEQEAKRLVPRRLAQSAA